MNRRQFLLNSGLLAAAPFAAAQQQGAVPQTTLGRAGRGAAAPRESRGLQPLNGGKIGNTPAMKITDIKTFLVGAEGRNWVYVKILTDQGIYGIGEAYSAGPDEATVKVIEDFKIWLIGNDPRNVQYLFDLMYNTTRFPGRYRRELRDERHRARAVGHRRQIRGRSGMGAAWRSGAK